MFLSLLWWSSWWGFVPPGVLAIIQCSCNDGQNHAGNISPGLGWEIALCVASCPLKCCFSLLRMKMQLVAALEGIINQVWLNAHQFSRFMCIYCHCKISCAVISITWRPCKPRQMQIQGSSGVFFLCWVRGRFYPAKPESLGWFYKLRYI